MKGILSFIQALPYTKRVILMIGILLTTALFSYGYDLYSSSKAEEYEQKQQAVVFKFFAGGFSDTGTKIFLAEKNYMKPMSAEMSKPCDKSRLNEKEQLVENELNKLFLIEQKFIIEQQTTGFVIFFTIFCSIILSCALLVRLIFRNSVGLKFHI